MLRMHRRHFIKRAGLSLGALAVAASGDLVANPYGKPIRRAGCRFDYHGHNFDYATVDGVVEYDELIRRTDPRMVNFELDCFWCVRAGKDPVDYFHRFPGRFPLLHIKDLKPGFPPT